MLKVDVTDGVINYEPTKTDQNEHAVGTTKLGKDAFLQLLVAQMQYQDPLEPSSDTEWISQLASFSSLEEMQNLNQTMTNQSAYGLVGKDVIIAVGQSEGTLSGYVTGRVDYTEVVNGEVQLSINGNLYSVNDLYSVVDEEYLNNLQDEIEKEEADKAESTQKAPETNVGEDEENKAE